MINIGEILLNLWESSGFARIFSGFVGDMTWQNVVMLAIGCLLLYLAIVKKFEPLLLCGIAFGCILTNLPGAGLYHQDLWNNFMTEGHEAYHSYGTILREGATVKGLTTAASLWAVACLGIAAGFGFYGIAIAGMIFIFITLTILEFLQRRLIGDPDPVKDYIMGATDLEAGLNALNTHAHKQTAAIQNIQVQRLDSGYRITFRGEIGGFRGTIRQQHFFAALAQDPAITMLQTLDAEAVAQ